MKEVVIITKGDLGENIFMNQDEVDQVFKKKEIDSVLRLSLVDYEDKRDEISSIIFRQIGEILKLT